MNPRAAGGRVLQVLQPEDGGVRQHVLYLAAGLVRRGWEVDVAASASAGPGSSYRASLEAAGVTVHTLPLTRAPGRADLRAAAALRRLDRDGGYQLVHAHSSKAGALVRAALPRRRRLVYTPHCFAFAAGFGPARAAYWSVEQALMPRTAAVIAASDWERAQALRLLGGRRLARRIHNGVPACGAAAPHPALARLRERGPVVGFLSRLDPPKEPLALVEAAKRAAAIGGLPGTVAIVGSGGLEPEVREAVASSGLGDRLVQLPFEAPVERYLRGFDVFVLTSRWESLPIAVLEAMACGLPVLASAVGGMGEAVRDGVTGRLVEPGSPDALAAAMMAMMADPAALRAMGEAGRRRWSEAFSVDRMVDETEALYRALGGV